MTPDDFIRKWEGVKLREKQASQEHFLDLCALVGVESPAKADPHGDWFCFEKGASKAGGGEGWADVWRRGYFAWEYKSPGKDLDAAFKQLQLYTPALEYPPLLIVSDIEVIRLQTAFTGLVPVCHVLKVADLRDPAKLALLKAAFIQPERLRPTMELFQGFLLRLQKFRVLDPACGSGNFLLLSLLGLKALEHRVITEAEALGLPRQFPMVGPENVIGIEINPFAAELARVSIWVGEIQWMLNHGFALSKSPILRNLDNIQLRDAILNPDGSEPDWPEVDAIVGNPPFLGGSKLLAALGVEYVNRLRTLYQGRVPGGADLVTYWFEKARAQIEGGRVRYTGLVATNSIRGGANRKVLERIGDTGSIYEAWSDEPWINEGAAVRVSLVAFAPRDHGRVMRLDGEAVGVIHANLTSGTGAGNAEELILTLARPLKANLGVCFMGASKKGPFDIPGDLARHWLTLPNPHSRSNVEVLRPLWNGIDLTRRERDVWIIDFGTRLSEEDAALYEAPFNHVLKEVKPIRSKNNRDSYRRFWWRHAEARPGMRAALKAEVLEF